MIAYFIVTALLMLLASILSCLSFVVKHDNAAFVRGLGELTIAAWGFWLAYRALA